MEKTYSLDWANKKLEITIGGVAMNASAAVRVRYGDTLILVTAVVTDTPREGIDFFPLTIDFEERFYASGKITSARFVKRENRPPESAVLTSRLIDRPIRPLFPKGFRNDVQVIATVLSVDMENDPDIPAIVGASLALKLTGAPFEGPLGALRVGLVEGKLVANPTANEREKSNLDLVVAGKSGAIMMVEAGSSEISEEEMIKAFEFALTEYQPVIELQEKIAKELNVTPKQYELYEDDKTLLDKAGNSVRKKLSDVIGTKEKDKRQQMLKEIEADLIKELVNEETEERQVKDVFDKIFKEEVRKKILEQEIRPDGRPLDEIRPLRLEVGLLPRTHGSGLFTRGETQALSVTTLAGPGAAQIIETMDEEYEKRYMHHYNFPPYSTGEAKPLRGLGRRDIGHGALAERALIPVLPDKAEFPYTIRVVSEILSSNGSTSMASVCGSTLSLLDAGVPLKKPVAGIAMGLMGDGDNFKILTDIMGTEDFAGDMDFKVAGTTDGITALQMDMKIQGISVEILKNALSNAKTARLFILDKIKELISAPKELSPLAPRIYTLSIHPDKIREVIGKGGETINKIISETGVDIDIDDDGMVSITSSDKENADRAIEWIKKLSWSPEDGKLEIGRVYQGKVTGIKDELGAFVEFLPGKEGLVHISKIKDSRVEKVSDELSVGDMVTVILTDSDSQGRYNLSIKGARGLKPGEVATVHEDRR